MSPLQTQNNLFDLGQDHSPVIVVEHQFHEPIRDLYEWFKPISGEIVHMLSWDCRPLAHQWLL